MDYFVEMRRAKPVAEVAPPRLPYRALSESLQARLRIPNDSLAFYIQWLNTAWKPSLGAWCSWFHGIRFVAFNMAWAVVVHGTNPRSVEHARALFVDNPKEALRWLAYDAYMSDLEPGAVAVLFDIARDVTAGAVRTMKPAKVAAALRPMESRPGKERLWRCMQTTLALAAMARAPAPER